MDELKVLIEHEWQDFDVEFGQRMPEEIGGVKVVRSDTLEEAVENDIGRLIHSLSVVVCEQEAALVVVYEDDDEGSDFYGYLARLQEDELLTYASRFS